MPIDPTPTWVDEISKLKPDDSKSGGWADKLADVVDQRVTSKLGISVITGQVSYTFNKAIFANLLKLALPSPAVPAGANAIANAWEAAAMASTIVVAPGAFIGASAPPTLFSVVTATLILPASIAVGKGLLLQQLLASAPVPDAKGSVLGPALFAAFSALQASVTGLNSVSPPAGPLPLVVPTAPVI